MSKYSEAIKQAKHCYSACGVMNSENKEFIDLVVSALREAEERKNPKPLTLEQLRERNGKPVYIVEHPDWGHWELSEDAEDYLEDRDPDFYGMIMPPTLPDPMGRYGLHMLGWLAYDHPPKEEK